MENSHADKPSPLTPPEVADVLRSVELRAGYIIGACKDEREMRLEAEEIKRLLAVAFKGLRDRATVTDKMVDRFLAWRLPEDFHPDAGISFAPYFNVEYNAKQGKPPQRHQPIGTNLFTAEQARRMLEHVLQGAAPSAKLAQLDFRDVVYNRGDYRADGQRLQRVRLEVVTEDGQTFWVHANDHECQERRITRAQPEGRDA